jgi:alkanesulfonate monooxygenase SsuD/methylene tetrahydromethanopterin reductase-like flavin-dependent oxidoreductase (luciferase family)
MVKAELTAAYAEALFVSSLQRTDDPTPAEVRREVAANLRRHGVLGCAACVAQEFGEHPIEAVSRMSWVLEELRLAYPAHAYASPSSTIHIGLVA